MQLFNKILHKLVRVYLPTNAATYETKTRGNKILRKSTMEQANNGWRPMRSCCLPGASLKTPHSLEAQTIIQARRKWNKSCEQIAAQQKMYVCKRGLSKQQTARKRELAKAKEDAIKFMNDNKKQWDLLAHKNTHTYTWVWINKGRMKTGIQQQQQVSSRASRGNGSLQLTNATNLRVNDCVDLKTKTKNQHECICSWGEWASDLWSDCFLKSLCLCVYVRLWACLVSAQRALLAKHMFSAVVSRHSWLAPN